MAVHHPLLQKSLAFLGASAGYFLRSTIDWRVAYCHPTTDTVHPNHVGRSVYCTWHENMLLPILMRGNRRMLAMASESGDGTLISMAMKYFGWSVARGSSSKGGVAALLKYLRDDDRHPIITPDGPRGPRRRMAVGPLFLASRLALPIICVGVGWEKPWRLRSWDRFAVPKPFSRARAVFGQALHIPANLDRAELVTYRGWFEAQLNWLTELADAWANSGERRIGEMPMLPSRAPHCIRDWNDAMAVPMPASLTHAWASLPGQNHADRRIQRAA